MSGELTAPCGLHSADRIPLREGLHGTADEFERLLEELDFEEYAALKARRNGVFGDYGAFGRVLPAIGGLLEFGFRELDMHRIFPTCDTENHASAHVIATGGSVVYSRRAMEHLADAGVIVHLVLPLDALRKRLTDLDSRGVVMARGETLEELCAERMPLYRRWAESTVSCDARSHEEVVDAMVEAVGA